MKNLLIALVIACFTFAAVGCSTTPDPYAHMDYCDRPDVDIYKDPNCLGGRDIKKQ